MNDLDECLALWASTQQLSDEKSAALLENILGSRQAPNSWNSTIYQYRFDIEKFNRRLDVIRRTTSFLAKAVVVEQLSGRCMI